MGSITIPNNLSGTTSSYFTYGYALSFVTTTLAGVKEITSMTYLVPGGSTPLVLDLNGDGVHTTDLAHGGVFFDLLGNDKPVLTAWANSKDGLLVQDLNGDGKINNGSELFGIATQTASGKAANGYEALGQYDINGDAVIDAKDAVFGKLQVWKDANGDGVTQVGELSSLQDLGIASLSLDALSSTKIENGNVHGMTSSWTGTDGQVHDMADVWFRNSPLEQLVQQATGPQKADLAADTGAATSSDHHTYAMWNNSAAHLLMDQNTALHQVI